MDELRIKNVQRVILQCVDMERTVLPIIEKCLQCMAQHAADIKADVDSQEVVSRYRSGYGLPNDYPFVDLSAEGTVRRKKVNNSFLILQKRPYDDFTYTVQIFRL